MARTKLCANVSPYTPLRKSINMNATVEERESSGEFSELYLRLLSAALGEANSSMPPQARKLDLAAHVARGISMIGIDSETFSNQGLGHGDTMLL